LYQSLSDEDEKERQVRSMVGDVNFYILDRTNAIAEIEIMIAEVSARRRGLGREAVLSMMKFGYDVVGVKQFTAKIKSSNVVSQKLFTDHFGFVEAGRSEIFDEITFQCDLAGEHKLKHMFAET